MLLLLALISTCTLSCSSSSPSFTQADLQAILDTELQTYSRDKTNFGGGIAMQIIALSGNYFISSGMRSGMDNSHRFRTASVTKTFTAASIMLLQERGQLNIDDKLSDNIPGTAIPYFPYNIPFRNEITIRMILMHRAGIFDLTNTDIQENDASRGWTYVGKNYIEETMKPPNEEHQFTFDELFSVIEKYEQVNFDPSKDPQYAYSDTGYSVLGYIIDRVSGKTYEAFVRDEFLIPNGLSNSSLPWQGTDRTLPAPFVNGYAWDGSTLTDVTVDNMSAFVGNGNMITTPLDLATWAKRLLTGQTALNMSTVELMEAGLPSGNTSTYGLGIKYTPNLGYGHEGDHRGYTTFMFYKPEQDIAYVALMNIWDESNVPASYAAQKQFLANTVLKVFARMGL